MSFGRNPHVAKAEAAELKAQSAQDDAAYEQAWREAARLWERAADREKDGRRRALYSGNADSAREAADTPRDLDEVEAAADVDDTEHPEALAASAGNDGAAAPLPTRPKKIDPSVLN